MAHGPLVLIGNKNNWTTKFKCGTKQNWWRRFSYVLMEEQDLWNAVASVPFLFVSFQLYLYYTFQTPVQSLNQKATSWHTSWLLWYCVWRDMSFSTTNKRWLIHTCTCRLSESVVMDQSIPAQQWQSMPLCNLQVQISHLSTCNFLVS